MVQFLLVTNNQLISLIYIEFLETRLSKNEMIGFGSHYIRSILLVTI